jgi:TRAP-type C4-dicarboxylate transport system permease small subunit
MSAPGALDGEAHHDEKTYAHHLRSRPCDGKPAMTGAPDRVPGLHWIDRLSMLLAAVGGAATVGLMANVVVDVIGRAIANRPLPGTVDLTASAWMPTLISLGLGLALLRAEHIRVNLLTAATRPRVQRVVEIVGMTSTLAVAVLFAFFGAESAAQATALGETTVGSPWLPVGPFRWIVVVGLAGLALQALAQLIRAATAVPFVPEDDDEVATALAAEEDVFDDLEPGLVAASPAPGSPERSPIR